MAREAWAPGDYEKYEESFWAKVRLHPTECWEWQSSCRKQGYGQIMISHSDGTRENITAHRLAYFYANGNFPKDFVCHACDNRKCCRPSHLWDGDNKANILDSFSKGRHPLAKLTVAQAGEIRARYASGETQASIAKGFGIRQTNVSEIVNNHTWVNANG